MFKAKLLVIGSLAAYALVGLAASPALAEGPVWLVNGKELKAGSSVEADGKGYLFFQVNGLEFTVECKKLTDTMGIKGGAPGTDSEHLEYSECMVVEKLPTCTADEPISVESETTLVYLIRKAAGEEWKAVTEARWEEAIIKGEQYAFGDEFKPKAGSFFTVKVLSKEGQICAVAGEYTATGTYHGLVNFGLEFTKESSKLEVNGKEAFATGFIEYFIINAKKEATGETLEVSQPGSSCSGGTKSVFCVGESAIHTAPAAVSGEGKLSTLATKVGTTEVKIHCTDNQFNGNLRKLGLGEGEVDFLGCSVEKPTTCTTTSLILADVHLQLSEGKVPALGTLTGNKGGVAEEFTSLTLSGASCSVAGTYTLTGKQTLEFPESEGLKEEHEVLAKKAGSSLKFGSEAASFSDTWKWRLKLGQSWLIMLGG